MIAGIDVSTKSVDIVLLETTGHAEWVSYELDDVSGWAAVDSIRQRIPHGVSLWHRDVELVAFEDPFSVSRGTAKTFGALIGAVWSLVPVTVPVMALTPHKWKEVALGRPVSDKREVSFWVAERWLDPPTVVTQDALDAYAIAWAARSLSRVKA